MSRSTGTPESVLLGRVPGEWHVPQGDGTVAVEREPLWLQVDREALEALRVYEAGVCGGCGFHDELVHNPHLAARFVDRTCPVCAASQQLHRAREQAESKGSDRPGHERRPTDGRHTQVMIERRGEHHRNEA